jgi:hypothetical protein
MSSNTASTTPSTDEPLLAEEEASPGSNILESIPHGKRFAPAPLRDWPFLLIFVATLALIVGVICVGASLPARVMPLKIAPQHGKVR